MLYLFECKLTRWRWQLWREGRLAKSKGWQTWCWARGRWWRTSTRRWLVRTRTWLKFERPEWGRTRRGWSKTRRRNRWADNTSRFAPKFSARCSCFRWRAWSRFAVRDVQRPVAWRGSRVLDSGFLDWAKILSCNWSAAFCRLCPALFFRPEQKRLWIWGCLSVPGKKTRWRISCSRKRRTAGPLWLSSSWFCATDNTEKDTNIFISGTYVNEIIVHNVQMNHILQSKNNETTI